MTAPPPASLGDFAPALEEFLGSAAGLSPSVITRLTKCWQADQRTFAERRLDDRAVPGSTSATLGPLAAPRGETMVERKRQTLPGLGVDPAVIDPRRLDLDGSRDNGAYRWQPLWV